ncbi:Os07g0685650 [Oryza sativa Japonica Group]|uniref:Os07g0685650 protein n=1 Tax=Oryza sativa subsp. japonica TaxID=39947 RepID=A0A0N7KP31_ORYSJ|nr:Os07g0685650 [Oryza sativa Japonica Group]
MEMEIVDMIQVLGPHLVPACVCTQSISTSDWYYYCYCYCTSLEVPIFRCLVSSCVCVLIACSTFRESTEYVPIVHIARRPQILFVGSKRNDKHFKS